VTATERWGDSRHETRVIAIAARQHGCVTMEQLRGAGMSRGVIGQRVKVGWLTRLHRGVYRVGPLSGPLTREMAALLACGPEAALCHRSAGGVMELLLERPAIVDVAVPGNQRNRPGIRVHRDHPLDQVTTSRGCRITTAAATIADLAPSLTQRELARAIEQAQILGLATREELLAALPSRRSRALTTALDQPRLTRSEAERRLLELIEKARLPRPHTNVRIGPHEVDLHWPEQRLIVEVDSAEWHDDPLAQRDDKLRQAQLEAAGERVVRVTKAQARTNPRQTLQRLRAAGAPSPGR
jgi:very-short-patch-repair endonuclease